MNKETPQPRINWRFRVPVQIGAELCKYDGSIFESQFKRVQTDLATDETPSNVYIQFSTQNCGKTIAIQRLVACLIESLTNKP